MEVFKLTTEIDQKGQLNINLPTNLTEGKVDLVVIINPVTEKDKRPNTYDFSDLVGKLSWQGNPVAEQRKLRDEW